MGMSERDRRLLPGSLPDPGMYIGESYAKDIASTSSD